MRGRGNWGEVRRWARRASECAIIAVACLSPWAFGGVEAWAELVIAAGIAMAALLGAVAGPRPATRGGMLCGPGLALAALALLGLAQATPMPRGWPERSATTSASAAGMSAAGWSGRILGDPGPPVPPPPTTLSLLPEGSWHAAARLATAWVLFQCVLGLGGGHEALRRFGWATAINAAVIALFALIQGLTWDGEIYWSRHSPVAGAWHSGGPFVGHGALAAYLNLGLGAVLAELLIADRAGGHRPGQWIWAAFVASVLVFGLIASQSRSGFVAMAVAGTVLAVVARRRGARRPVAPWIVVPILVAALLIALSAWSPYERLASMGDPDSLGDRLEIWGATLRAWSDHRLLGAGLGSFAVAAAPEFRTDWGVAFARAENEYLDVLLEGGLVGLGIVLAGLAALARRGRRALAAATSPRDRAAVAGAMFGLLALAVQAAGDFSPHIAGVAITAIILAAHVSGLAPAAGASAAAFAPRGPRRGRGARTLEAVGVAVVGLALLPHALARARAEARLAGTGLPPPGSSTPAKAPADLPVAHLEAMRGALEAALRDRPDWAEGHVRLGLTSMALYERTTSDWIADRLDDPAMTALIADPLRLHAVAHSGTPAGEIALQEPVRRHLVPAARSFLEALRCAPTLATAHAHLAALDYLLASVDAGPAHAERAFRLAGGDRATLDLAARAALQAGDPDLAARCWRRALEARPWDWEETALTAAASLSPGEVLERVLPTGAGWPVAVADRAYADPDDQEDRAAFLQAALDRLPADASLPKAERLRLEAYARAGLGQDDRAGPLYEDAMRLEPLRGEWREELVAWLFDRGDLEAAHRHAVLGVRLNPDRPALRRALERIDEAMARGKVIPGSIGAGRGAAGERRPTNRPGGRDVLR